MKGETMAVGNEYQRAYGRLYDAIPKSVLAAIAFSYASSGGDRPVEAIKKIMREWAVLHDNGIVPQKPVSGYYIQVPEKG